MLRECGCVCVTMQTRTSAPRVCVCVRVGWRKHVNTSPQNKPKPNQYIYIGFICFNPLLLYVRVKKTSGTPIVFVFPFRILCRPCGSCVSRRVLIRNTSDISKPIGVRSAKWEHNSVRFETHLRALVLLRKHVFLALLLLFPDCLDWEAVRRGTVYVEKRGAGLRPLK